MRYRKILICSGIAAISILAATTYAGDPPDALAKQLVKAIAANDLQPFQDHGTPAVKAGFTKPTMQAVHAQYSPRLKQGFSLTYLGLLRQQGLDVHLYKLSYKDGGDDTLVRLVMQTDKIAGFFLQ